MIPYTLWQPVFYPRQRSPVFRQQRRRTSQCIKVSNITSLPKESYDLTKIHSRPPFFKDDFRAWDAHKRQPYKLSDNLKVSPATFTTTTTFKDAFCPKSPGKMTENFKPTPPARESQPFDGTTNYKTEYITHPLPLRTLREKPLYQSNSSTLTRVFTTHENYKGLPQPPASSCKPKVTWERNPAPFEGTSESREKFKTWPLEPKFQRKAEEYSPPTQNMASLSTTHADYMAHKFQRRRSARLPVEAWERKGETFQTNSTMKEDYRVWDTIRCPPIIHKEELEWSKDEIEKTTTYRSVFTPKHIQRSISCKPLARPSSHSKSMMEDITTYHSSYNTKPQRITAGAEEPRLYQTTSVDAVGTHPDNGIC
ncbi:stabilizer of axonemal microtubules 2 [Genypterus blacodes]|uniref:stabilizer of axonemal microtubules 2 n=1 Tax=Genypterus blacodes TaxID=154954 RepID=UPI003F769585